MGCGQVTDKGTSSTTATATPQEQQLENNELQVSNANLPNQMAINNNSASLINSILTGNYSGTAAGITPGQTQSMVNASLRDIAPQFQTSGILNSGEAAQIAGRTAMDTQNTNAQFNVQAQQNLLSGALDGGSSWSSTNNQNSATTGSQLAGLRSVNGSTSSLTNPFLQSFYNSTGTGFGNTATSALNSAIGSSTNGGQNFGSSFMNLAGG